MNDAALGVFARRSRIEGQRREMRNVAEQKVLETPDS